MIYVIAKHGVIEMSTKYRYNIEDSINGPGSDDVGGPCDASGRDTGDGVSADGGKPPKPIDQRFGYAPGNWVQSIDPIDETPVITFIATTFDKASIRREIIRRVVGSKGCTVIEPWAAFGCRRITGD